MRVDGIRMLADWLKRDDYGANAMLPNVPQDAGDPEVPLVRIADETRDSWVARKHASREVASSGPHLALWLFEQIDFDGLDHLDAATWQEGELAIAIGYIDREDSSQRGNTFAGRTMRAVRGSITLLNLETNFAFRQRNGVRLEECVSIHEIPVNQPWGDAGAFVSGGMVVRYNAVDLIPDATT